MKKRIVFVIIVVLFLLLMFPMSSAVADDDAKLIVYYDFDGDFTDTLNGSTLTAFDVAGDGQNHNNATSSFGTDTGEGDTTYWQWTSDQARGGGFWIDVDDLNILENYSIGVRFVYDDISEGSSWDKIIDYKDRVTDDGFYFYNGKLQFYPNSAGTGTTVFAAGTILDIVVTRDATTGDFIAYTVEDGTRVKQIDYDDLTTQYAIPAEVAGKVRFGFFHDDTVTASEATSGGKVYSIKVWNGPITAEQATGAMEEPNTLSFDGNGETGGAAPSDILANEGDNVTIPDNTGSLVKPTKAFDGWNTQDDGYGDNYAAGSTYLMTAADDVLYANWIPSTYTVRYNANGGSGSMSDQSFTYDIAQNLTENAFTYVGKSFAGWATTADGAAQYSQGQEVSNLSDEDGAVVPLYAKWASESYDITYNLGGGTNDAANPDVYTDVTPTITFADATKTSYIFGGWFTDAGCSAGNEITQIISGSTGNVQVWAKWTPESYDITYNLDGGTNGSANPNTYTIESGEIVLADATKTGYTFGGWFTDSGCSAGNEMVKIASGSTGDVQVWAKWTINTYDITYNLDGGSNEGSNPSTYNIETPKIMFADATKASYGFDGWFTDAGCTAGNEITQIPNGSSGDVQVWAKWTPIEYTITYRLDGGENNANNPATYNIENTTILLGEPSRDGYLFSGWYTDAAFTVGNEITEISAGSTGEVSVWVKWTAIDEQSEVLGGVKGKIENDKGQGQANVAVTLKSNPRTMYTDANGNFSFDHVAFTNHTLVITNSKGAKIGEYALDFTQGSDTRVVINGAQADITYENNAVIVHLDISMNEAGTGTTLEDVTVIGNPDTGADSNIELGWLIWLGIGLVSITALVGILIILAAIKARRSEA